MMKNILLISLIFFLNGCEDKEIVFPSSCPKQIKQIIVCQNFLKNLEVSGLEYQGCEEIEAVPSNYFEATYFIKEENIVDVEKKLIKKVNIQNFTNLNAIQLTKSISKAYFCIDNIEVSLFVNLKNNPLGTSTKVDSNNKDYKLMARVPAGEI